MKVTIVLLSLILALVAGKSLIAVSTASSEKLEQLSTKLSGLGLDVRGSHRDFVLVVDDVVQSANAVSLFPYDSAVYSYAVIEEQKMDFNFVQNTYLNLSLTSYSVLFHGHYIVAVEHDLYLEFTGSLPFNFEVVMVSESTISRPFSAAVDPALDALFESMSVKLRTAAKDPLIEALIKEVHRNDIQNFATYLSGETSNITTRQAQSTGAVQAQNYFESTFTSYGFKTSTHAFRAGYSSNVIAEWPGSNSSLVLITAHYDSRAASSTNPTARAPGANDNGSGSAGILTIAKIFHALKPRFKYTVRLVVVSGEEQGLLGSAAYASLIKSQNAKVVAVLNADMIAYRKPGEIQQLAFPSGSSTASLNSLLGQVAKEYVPQLTIGTSNACCTDHASFYNQGYPAASYFERNGGIADPMYHNVGDLVFREGYDLAAQYPAIVQAWLAGLATVAEISF